MLTEDPAYNKMLPLVDWLSLLLHSTTSPPVVLMDLVVAKEISAEDFTSTSPLMPPVRVSIWLLMLTPAPYKDTGPAMVKSELTVKADVLLVAPKLKPVKVLAKLYVLVLNAVANVPPSVGAMPNLPVPVNVVLIGRVLFWKINSPAEMAVAPE